MTNIAVTDTTRSSASAIVAQITEGGGCTNTASCGPGVIVKWPAFSLAAGQSKTLNVGSQVANGTPDGTVIHNAATVSYIGGSLSQGVNILVHH